MNKPIFVRQCFTLTRKQVRRINAEAKKRRISKSAMVRYLINEIGARR